MTDGEYQRYPEALLREVDTETLELWEERLDERIERLTNERERVVNEIERREGDDDDESKIDDMVREIAWNHYWEGYKLGKDVESFSEIDKRSARSQFERYWERNHK
jgi:recombinational DNA repair ATPase RecF